MSLIQDQIVIVKPHRVLVGTDRDTDEVKRYIEIDELVAQWWVPEGAELVGDHAVPPWVERGVRQLGWRLVRKSAAHTVTDLDAPVMGVRWAQVAEDMASMIRAGQTTEALDMYVTAEMQQMAFEGHEHVFGADPNPLTRCRVDGCALTYAERPTEPTPGPVQRPLPEWDDHVDE